jgi:hypothetical protein
LAERTPRTSGHLVAPATERPPHEAVHARLIEEYKTKHAKDPSRQIWFRLLEQAKAEVAAAHSGKRPRRARDRPGFVDVDSIP